MKLIFVTPRFLQFYDLAALAKTHQLFVLAPLVDVPEVALEYVTTLQVKAIQLDACLRAIDQADVCVDAKARIICHDDVSMVVAAQLRKHFALEGLQPEAAKLFHNKITAKEYLSARGISVPQFARIPTASAEKAFDQLKLPIVAKPSVGASSKGLHYLLRPEQLKAFVKSKVYEKTEYEFEQYIHGELFHVDMVMQAGEPMMAIACRYNKPMGTFIKGNNIGSIIIEGGSFLGQRLIGFAKQVLSAVNYQNGSCHMEVFLTPDNKMIFLECAARLPGGLAIPLYTKLLGINPLMLDLQVQLQQKVSPVTCQGHGFWILYRRETGRVGHVIKPDLALAHEITYHANIGQHYLASRNLSETSAALMCWDKQHKLDRTFARMCVFKPVGFTSHRKAVPSRKPFQYGHLPRRTQVDDHPTHFVVRH